MGFRPSPEELLDILKEIDEDGSGEIEFGEFCQLCAKFLVVNKKSYSENLEMTLSGEQR